MVKKIIILLGIFLCLVFLLAPIRNLPDRGVKVLAPIEGDILVAGTTFEIRWYADPGLGNLLTIEFSPDSGKSWEIIAEEAPNKGMYLWKVSEKTSSNCKIRIFFKDKPRFRGTSGKFAIK